jgi:SAM-dependent methyltransferase
MTSDDNGWASSANAWVAHLGSGGDFGRRYVLDPIMLPRALATGAVRALDVGCGEGRFVRMLRENGVAARGVDPTARLIEIARTRGPADAFDVAGAEALPQADASVDLVVSYLSLIDIADYRTAIAQMVRVLKPGGALLVANLNGFNTAGAETSWIETPTGEPLHYPVDNYLDERGIWVQWNGIRVINHHRPLSAYMQTFLALGLELTFFEEPAPSSDAPPARAVKYRRAPWFLVMEWRKPAT